MARTSPLLKARGHSGRLLMSGGIPGIESFLNQDIVLDTAGPLTYLGTLEAISADGLWLINADVRDRNDGHVSKERYVAEAKRDGIVPNRKRVFVPREVVMSCSRLEDVIGD